MSEAAGAPASAVIDRDLVFEIEQFYYAEARLLDDRLFKQWLTLLTPDVKYTILMTVGNKVVHNFAIDKIDAAATKKIVGAATKVLTSKSEKGGKKKKEKRRRKKKDKGERAF